MLTRRRCHRPGREVERSGRVVRTVLRCHHLDGERHREHGLGLPRPAPDQSPSPRTAARSTSSSRASTSALSPTGNAEANHVDAHQGFLVMTPDSAMVLTGKQSLGLLRWCVGRGQLRYRWLRPRHGPQRPGAVLGPPTSLRRARSCSVTTHTRTSLPANGSRAAQRRTDPVDRDVRSFPHTHPSTRLRDGRRHLLLGEEPGSQEALRHSHRDAVGGRPGPLGSRALGRHGRRRHLGRSGRASRRTSGHSGGHRIPRDPT